MTENAALRYKHLFHNTHQLIQISNETEVRVASRHYAGQSHEASVIEIRDVVAPRCK